MCPVLCVGLCLCAHIRLCAHVHPYRNNRAYMCVSIDQDSLQTLCVHIQEKELCCETLLEKEILSDGRRLAKEFSYSHPVVERMELSWQTC